VYATRFLGRERELTQLAALGASRRGADSMPTVLLGAAAGMGKSRLIAEHRAAAETSRVVAFGACLAYAGAILSPFVHIVQALAERSPETVRAHPRIFERLDTFGDRYESNLQMPAREEKLRLFELYSAALKAFSRETPITLVLEDVHWADSNSLELIAYFARLPGAGNLALIATYRSDELSRGQELRSLVGRLSPLPNVERIELPPLDDSAIDVLVQGILAGTLVDKTERNAIRVRAEGNPLFAEELARHVREHCERHLQAGLPLSIEDAVCARLPLLSTDERSILLRAAVLGRHFDADTLADIASVPVARVLEMLRRVRDLAFILEGPPPCFTFRHALTQEALYNELLEAERRTIHEQTLAILETRQHGSASVAALAHHAWAARDTDKAARYNEQAGDDAAKVGAVVEAATLYERALQFCRGGDAEAARLQEKLAGARLRAGFPDRAIASYTKTLALRQALEDRPGIAACALGIADAYVFLGEDERSFEYLELARDILRAEPQHDLRVRAMLYSARIALAGNDIRSALGHLSAVEEFRDSLDWRSAVLFHTVRADAKLMQRRYDEAIADQQHAVDLTVCGDDRRFEAETRATLGSIFLLAGRLPLAATAYHEACTVADENFDVGQATLYRTHYVETRLMLGHTEDAKSIILDLMAAALQTENPAFIVLLGRAGIFVSLRAGDRALAKRIVERLELEERFRIETPSQLFPVSGAYAQYLFEEGRADEAMVVLRRAVHRLTQKRLRSTDWSVCTLLTVAAHGSNEELTTARDVLATSFSALASAFLALFDAIASLRANREDEARALARAAATGLRSFEFRYEEALAWDLAGEKQVALDIFNEIGAFNDVRRLQRSMLTVNRRGRAENELTSREHEIAKAIAAGQTNRMIAERYCITEKTVETHVASIFARLRIRTRGEVAGRLVSTVLANR
jgi:DNA-binding CsgD family transcriptional regulator